MENKQHEIRRERKQLATYKWNGTMLIYIVIVVNKDKKRSKEKENLYVETALALDILHTGTNGNKEEQ